MTEPTIEHMPTTSPRSSISSAGSHGYSGSVATTALPGAHTGRGSIDVSATTYDHMRQITQPITSMSHWNTSYPSVASPSPYTIGHEAHPGRSWDMSAFPDQQQLSNIPAHPIQYYAGSTPTAHVHPPVYPAHSQAHS
jgi:hypothetical protein